MWGELIGRIKSEQRQKTSGTHKSLFRELLGRKGMKEKAAHFALTRLLGWASEHNAPRGGHLRGQMRLEQGRICAPGRFQEAKL